MNPQDPVALRHRRVSDIFLSIVDLPPEARAEVLNRECGDDAALRAEVMAMIDADSISAPLLDSPVANNIAQVTRTELHVPDRVGSFRLLERIGEGGMGVVHRAEQDSPRRIVAVKLLRSFMSGADARARFANEVHVLARLDHPNIARVLESGVAIDGLGNDLPWFAMEYVPGAPLMTHARASRLDHRARVDLFLEVLDAVAHAHRNGVIHRDLKGANILVDSQGRPRVLDFGIARLREEEDQRSTFTHPGTVLGTLECMSPEQAEGRVPDTRTDVFALGLLLYELLLDEPARSFTGLSWSDAIARVANAEVVSPRIHHRALDPDLAIVVAHAIEREPERRYDNAADFAADLRRWRNGEPILARPSSAWYRLSKWLGRHRLTSALAAAVVIVFVTGFIATFFAWREATRREAEALRANSIASAVDGYLTRSLLLSADPKRDGRDTRVVELLERASRGLDEAYPNEPDLRASIRVTLARSFNSLNDSNAAEREALQAIDLRTRVVPSPLELLDAHHEVAIARIGNGNFEGALGEARLVVSGRTELLGAAHEKTLRARADVESCRYYCGEREDAYRTVLELTALADRDFGTESDLALRLASDASVMAFGLGLLEDAEKLNRRCLDAEMRKHGPDHPSVWYALGNLAEVLEARGALADAVDLHRQLLESGRRIYGEESAMAARSRVGLASALANGSNDGPTEESLSLLREAVAIADRTGGNQHPVAIEARRELARQLSETGEHDSAAKVAAEVVTALRVRFAGKDHRDLAGAINTQARVEGRARRFPEAAAFAEESVAMFRRLSEGVPSPDFAQALFNCGRFLRECGRTSDAIPILQEALTADIAIYGANHRDVAHDRMSLARAYVAAGRAEEARPHVEQALTTFEREYGPTSQAANSARELLTSLSSGEH